MKKILVVIISIILVNIFSNVTVLANARWTNPTSIRTYIEPNSKQEIMKKAFSDWTVQTRGKIAFKYVDNPDKAQIKVMLVRDTSKTSKMDNAIGVTYHQSAGDKMISARIEVSTHNPTNKKLFSNQAIYKTMFHEIGHAIGIFDHSEDPMSVMYYAKGSRYQALTPGDLKMLGKIYQWN